MSDRSAFQQGVLNIVRTIPSGKVMSYGQVAVYMGTPRAAREVGWAMHSLDGSPDFPWWRVLNNAGKITIKEEWEDKPRKQMHNLEDEGVEFASDYQLDMKRYRFIPDKKLLQTYGLGHDYIAEIIHKFDSDPGSDTKQISLLS